MAAQNYIEPARRRHPRVPADFMVTAHTGGQTLRRRAVDLSMTGLKMEGDAEGDLLLLELPLAGDRPVFVRSRVLRREGTRTAVRFEELDWGDICALARFVAPRLP